MLRAMKSADPFRAQLVVEDLGAIERAEMTIRPLTLFFGPNGTNKTWAAYALYGLLRRYHSGAPDPSDAPVDLVERVDAALKTPRGAREYIGSPIRHTVTFPSLDGAVTLSGHELGRQLALDREAIDLGSTTLSLTRAHAQNRAIDVRIAVRPSTGGVALHSPLGGDPSALAVDVGPHVSARQVIASVHGWLRQISRRVVALPAERKALLTLHHQLSTLSLSGPQIEALLSGTARGLSSSLIGSRLSDSATSMERSLPLPSADFILEVDRAWNRRPGTPPGPLAHLADVLEGILGGRIEFALNALGSRSPHLRFRSGELDLPIHSTHSLARSLGGLDLYLQEVAAPGDFVFIDEPEMNAHPQTQLAIAEIIALMVNAGLRVVVTTHSPYIVDHLHNLIEAAQLDPDRQARFVDRFQLGMIDAFISAEAVSAYHFGRDGRVMDVFDREDDLIDWEVFGVRSDDVTNLYSELLAARRDG